MVQISSEHLVDNKFLLGTTILAFASWVIAFGGHCGIGAGLGAGWWIIIFELLLIIGITFLHLTDLFHQYRLVVLAFLAVSISYITSVLTVAIEFAPSYYRAAAGAIAAGYIILIIIQIAWIFAFGSDPQSYIGEFVKNQNSVQQQPPQHHHQQQQQQQQFQQQPIELTSDKTAFETTAASPTTNNNVNNGSHQASPALSHPSAVNSPVLEYKERVEALHDYAASPDDPNELSFARGEVLEIVDRRGNWWQARKSDGTVGIIPSNYFAA